MISCNFCRYADSQLSDFFIFQELFEFPFELKSLATRAKMIRYHVIATSLVTAGCNLSIYNFVVYKEMIYYKHNCI